MRKLWLLFWLPLFAWAEEPGGAPILTVRGSSYPGPGDSVFTLTDRELLRLSAAVTVKNMAGAEEGADVALADTLDQIPGVYARSRNQSAQTRLSIRGSGVARNADVRGIALQLNGLPLNVADSDFDYMGAIEPLTLSQIRVIRSPNAEGATVNNLGGSIDFISHTGRDAAAGDLRAEFGSYGYFRQHGAGAWQTEQSDGYGAIDNLMLDGFRDHSQQNRQHFDLNAAWTEPGSWENRFFFTRVQSDEELPGALTQAQMIQNPRQAATSPNPLFDRAAANWHDNVEWNRVADRFAIAGTDQRLSGGVWFSFAEIRNPRNQVFDVDYQDTGARLAWQRDMFVGERENKIFVSWTPSYAWSSDPVYQNMLDGNRGPLVDDTRKRWVNSDLYLQNRLEITPQLAWILSLQFGYALRSIDDSVVAAGGSATNDSKDYYTLSPATGLLYEPAKDLQFYGNLARSAEPPTMADLYQPGFANFLGQKMQTAITAEAGARGKRGALRWEAAFYQSWLQNEFLISETFPGSGLSVTRNSPQSTHRGVEAGLAWELLPPPAESGAEVSSLLLETAFTWNNFFLKNDPLYADNRLPGVPEYLLQGQLRYRHASGFYAAPGFQLQPAGMFADYANTLRSDAFALFNLRIGYESPRGPQVFFEVQNLGGENYAGDVSVIGNANGMDQRVFWPGTGRAFYGGLAWKW